MVDYPVGHLQELFIQLDSIRSGAFLGPDFTLRSAFEIRGDLDIPRLSKAAQSVVERHTALRTTIVHGTDGNIYVQRVSDGRPVNFEVKDLGSTGRDDPARIQAVITEEASLGIDIGIASPLRLVLIRVHAAHHILLVVLHHMVTDAMSMIIVMRCLADAYNSPRSAPDLLATDYAGYSALLAGRKEKAKRADGEYWARVLTGIRPIHFPHDHGRTEGKPDRKATVTRPIPDTVTSQAKLLASTTRSSLYMVLATVFSALVAELCEVDDVYVPTNFSGRIERETQLMIGPLVSGFVLRAQLERSISVSGALTKVRKAVLDAYGHLNVSIVDVVGLVPEILDVLQDPKFIWTYFQLMPAPTRGDFALEGLETYPVPYLSLRAAAGAGMLTEDLIFTVFETDDELEISMRYSESLFERERIEQIAGVYIESLVKAIQSPEEKLRQIVSNAWARGGAY